MLQEATPRGPVICFLYLPLLKARKEKTECYLHSAKPSLSSTGLLNLKTTASFEKPTQAFDLGHQISFES